MGDSPAARAVREALHARYNRSSQGQPGERWICIEEARAGAGFDGNQGRCDFLAVNTWQSRGLELVGHEIKVSVRDWRAELDNPAKAERFARYCRRWWVAAPSELASKIRHEVPPAWGLLAVSDSGQARQVVPAPATEPAEVPAWWWIGWLAQIDRQHKRRVPHLVQAGMADAREKMEARIEAEVDRRREFAEHQVEHLRANAERLKAATGIDLQREWGGNIDNLGQVWTLVKQAPPLDHLAASLRRLAEAIDPAEEPGSAREGTAA